MLTFLIVEKICEGKDKEKHGDDGDVYSVVHVSQNLLMRGVARAATGVVDIHGNDEHGQEEERDASRGGGSSEGLGAAGALVVLHGSNRKGQCHDSSYDENNIAEEHCRGRGRESAIRCRR